MSGTGMLLCPVEYEDEDPGGGGVSKRRQFIHCQWAPVGTDGDADPGVIGTVGLSDDRGFFQLLRLGTNDSSFFRVGTEAQDFHEPHSGECATPGRRFWDARPWSQFAMVPGDRGAVVFLQWQSNMVLWARVSKRRAQPIARLGSHDQRVRVVVVDEAGDSAASGSDDGAVKLWALDTLAASGVHEAAHNGAVTALHFHDGGKHLFSAGSDQRVCWWDVSSDALLAEFRTHAAPLLELTTSPSAHVNADQTAAGQGYELYGGHADGTLVVWSLKTKELLRSVHSHAGSNAAVLSVGVAPTDDLAAVGQLDGTLGAHKAGGTAEGPQVAGEMIGQCKLSSAVVWVGFQPPHQRGVKGDSVDHQLLCVCCREGVQFWSTAHLLSRVTHPADAAANEHHENLQAPQPVAAGDRVPTPSAAVNRATKVDLDLETPRPEPTSPPPTFMNTDVNMVPPGSSLQPVRISRQGGVPHERLSPEEAKPTPEPEPDPELDSESASANAAEGGADAVQQLQHSAAATPVASPERTEDAGAVALAARRALVKGAAESGASHDADCSPLTAFTSPSEANFGNPLAFASVLVNSNRQRAQEESARGHQHGADAQPGDDSPAVASPQMNSTLRLVAQLDEIKRERPAAEAIAQVRAAARPARCLLNFSRHDRKYGCLTSLEPTPEEDGPNADLPPV